MNAMKDQGNVVETEITEGMVLNAVDAAANHTSMVDNDANAAHIKPSPETNDTGPGITHYPLSHYHTQLVMFYPQISYHEALKITLL